MRILVVSDTHRKNDTFARLLGTVGPVDLIVHCGDAEGSEYFLTKIAKCPMKIVLGNCDYFSSLPRELDFNVGKHKVWVTHGHDHFVYGGNGRLKKEAKERGADVVLYGHTHCPLIDTSTPGIVAVNPGSISYPRQEGGRPSYAIMEEDRFGDLHFTISYL